MKKVKFCVLVLAFSFGLSAGAYAQDEVATTPSEQLKECLSQKGNYPNEARACLVKCRIPANASEAQVNQCLDAYNAYRKVSGQSMKASPSLMVKSFQLDHLTATFFVKNSRPEALKLVGENSELAQRAAEVCIFKFPDAQSHDGPKFQAQFNDQIRTIRNQGKSFAYKFSDINWSEDGRATHYTCVIGRVDVVAIQ
jgi:hypothetical protein